MPDKSWKKAERLVARKNKYKTSAYERGRRFEYRVRRQLKEEGYFVVRSAKSGTVCDLVALKKGEILLIQCKLNKKISKKEREELAKLAEQVGGKALLAYSERRKLKFEEVKGGVK